MPYVIQRREDSAFVAPPGERASYVRSLQYAAQFLSRAVAEHDACENERVLTLEEAMETRPR